MPRCPGMKLVGMGSSGVLGRIGVPGQGLLLGSTGGAGRWKCGLCARPEALVRARTRAKNEAHAVPARNLCGRPPVTDCFGRQG